MEGLKAGTEDDDIVPVILREIGPDKIGYISLIHQLLVCEDFMHDENK